MKKNNIPKSLQPFMKKVAAYKKKNPDASHTEALIASKNKVTAKDIKKLADLKKARLARGKNTVTGTTNKGRKFKCKLS